MVARRLSIIVPARNDAAALERSLDHLAQLAGIDCAEIIVSASGDPGGSERVVSGRGRLLQREESSRAALMNAGADAASGEIFFFLHADSFPPRDALRLIDETLSDDRIVGGAFEHVFVERDWRLRSISRINQVRYRLTRNYYGDQGIFVRASTFRRMGGYRNLALLEDLDFSRRLKGIGRSVLIPVPLQTSGRRFLARGPVRTFLFIVWLLLLHTLRLDTERYAERWRGPADCPPGSPWPRGRQSGTAEPRGKRDRIGNHHD